MRATFRLRRCRSLLAINFVWIDFGAKPLYSALAIAGALLTQAVCSRIVGLPRIDLRSALITGLSLSLLLRADAPWLPALAGVVAIASKFLLRIDGKHIWNPAGFAIVALLADIQRRLDFAGAMGRPASGSHRSLAFLAILVLHASQRSDIALFFLGSHAALLSCPRALARRSAGHSAAPDAERVAADLRLLHDLRSANHAGFARSAAFSSPSAWRCLPTISRSSCKCGRRYTSR